MYICCMYIAPPMVVVYPVGYTVSFFVCGMYIYSSTHVCSVILSYLCL